MALAEQVCRGPHHAHHTLADALEVLLNLPEFPQQEALDLVTACPIPQLECAVRSNDGVVDEQFCRSLIAQVRANLHFAHIITNAARVAEEPLSEGLYPFLFGCEAEAVDGPMSMAEVCRQGMFNVVLRRYLENPSEEEMRQGLGAAIEAGHEGLCAWFAACQPRLVTREALRSCGSSLDLVRVLCKAPCGYRWRDIDVLRLVDCVATSQHHDVLDWLLTEETGLFEFWEGSLWEAAAQSAPPQVLDWLMQWELETSTLEQRAPGIPLELVVSRRAVTPVLAFLQHPCWSKYNDHPQPAIELARNNGDHEILELVKAAYAEPEPEKLSRVQVAARSVRGVGRYALNCVAALIAGDAIVMHR